jgi:hypothetical protein
MPKKRGTPKTGGRAKGTPNKKTVAKLAEVGREIAEARKQEVPRAKKTLQDLMVTAMGWASQYQRKIMEWQAQPGNAGKEPPADIVDRFWQGMEAAGRFATALAPYQDPRFTAIKVSMSPLDIPDAPKLIEGKANKIDMKDPMELARIYHQMVRAA